MSRFPASPFASRRRACIGAAFAAALLAFATPSPAEETDPASGLRLADDWQLVRNNCIACHSLKLVTQQRGDARHWLGLIRWMQDTQNLWPFDPDTEQRIVAYLAENYPPAEDRRRAPLPKTLLPPNPYANPGEQ